MTRKATFLVQVDLDTTEGMMHTPDSAKSVIEATLGRIMSHYNPKVTPAEDPFDNGIVVMLEREELDTFLYNMRDIVSYRPYRLRFWMSRAGIANKVNEGIWSRKIGEVQ